MDDALGTPRSLLVLGGNSRIARAMVDRLVQQGTARVILGVREPVSAVEYVDALQRRGVDARTVRFDAAEPAMHEAVIEASFRQASEVSDAHSDAQSDGDIDAVLLAFGVLGDQAELERDSLAAVALATVNYLGAVSCALASAARLRRQGHGLIIVLSSVAGQRPRRANYVYGSAKAGLDFFARGLADAVRPDGVRVLIVRPGFVRTRMTAHLRAPWFLAVDPERVAADIVTAIARRDEVVWSPRWVQLVALAMRLLPGPLWRWLTTRAHG